MKSANAASEFSPEIEAMATCIAAFEPLTPEERVRAVEWLWERLNADIAKERAAAEVVGYTARDIARGRRRVRV